MTNYIHFEDGRDLAMLTTYKMCGRYRFTYQYEDILFTSDKKLTNEQLRNEIKKREVLLKNMGK
jgi:hypothetical protein